MPEVLRSFQYELEIGEILWTVIHGYVLLLKNTSQRGKRSFSFSSGRIWILNSFNIPTGANSMIEAVATPFHQFCIHLKILEICTFLPLECKNYMHKKFVICLSKTLFKEWKCIFKDWEAISLCCTKNGDISIFLIFTRILTFKFFLPLNQLPSG